MEKKTNTLSADVSMIKDERLKRLIRNVPIPHCLTNRPLMVGDDEQCKALHQYERNIQLVIDEYEYDDENWFYCAM